VAVEPAFTAVSVAVSGALLLEGGTECEINLVTSKVDVPPEVQSDTGETITSFSFDVLSAAR
jgi:hypothetical protein